MLKVCDLKQLIKSTKDIDQIVCYGAGKRLEMLKRLFINTEVWDKFKYVIDNDEKKHNTQISIAGKLFEIISLKTLKSKRFDRFVIIITCAQYTEIAKQLDTDIILRNVDYYSLSHVQFLTWEENSLQKEVPLDIKLCKEPLIPKVIHYCWFGGKPLPDKYRAWMDSWRRYCPDYEIIEWNESNYDISKNTYMHQAYECQKWGFVPDYARLDIIFHYGGIYLDTDVELLCNIDDLLYQKGFIGFDSEEYINLGAGFGAVKGLPIIGEMMDGYNEMIFLKPDGSLDLTPSGVLQTQILKKHGLKMDGEYQIVDDLTIFPEKMLSGQNVYTKKIILKPYTRAIHHHDGSWLDEKQKNFDLQVAKEMMQCKEIVE